AVDLAVAGGEGADGDIGVEAAIGTHVADAAAVDTPGGGLQFGDDFHGAPFGRPGDGAAGEGVPQQFKGCAVRRQGAGDGADQVVDIGEALQGKQLRHLD